VKAVEEGGALPQRKRFVLNALGKIVKKLLEQFHSKGRVLEPKGPELQEGGINAVGQRGCGLRVGGPAKEEVHNVLEVRGKHKGIGRGDKPKHLQDLMNNLL